MDRELYEKIYECFGYLGDGRYGDPQNAHQLVEEHLKEIDFDDEDDMEELMKLVIRALQFTKEDGTSGAKEGLKFLEFLISKGFDINFKLLHKECLILKLAEEEIAPAIFQKVVDLGADVYSENKAGNNVLTTALGNSTEELAAYIAKHFDTAAFDHTGKYGLTPLMWAVLKDMKEVAKGLLKSGSDVNATGGQEWYGSVKTYGVSPFALACREGNLEMAKMLLKAGADDALCDAEGTPACFSLLFKPVESARTFAEDKTAIVPLLKHPNCIDSEGNTMLIKAFSKEEFRVGKEINPSHNEAIVRALLARGAKINAKNNEGESAVYMAAKWESPLLKELIEAGANLNQQDSLGDTALHVVCRHRREDIARLLVRKGANYKLKNKKGKTAMDVAIENGLADVLDLMV